MRLSFYIFKKSVREIIDYCGKLKFFTGKGFTLMEIIIYAAVLSIIIVSISSFVLWSISSNKKLKATREVLESTRRAMEIMTHDIKGAKSIYEPTTTSSQLSLETVNYLPTGEETSYIDFYLCGTQLCSKKEGRSPVFLISSDVEIVDLSFTKVVTGNITSVQINLQANYKNPNNRPELQAPVNLQSSVSLRAY